MTRTEQLAQDAAKTKAQLNRIQIQAAQRAEAKKQRERRRLAIGTMADQAGLFAWDDLVFAQLFTLMAERLVGVPDPVALLEALLSDQEEPAVAALNGHGRARSIQAEGGVE